MGSGNTSVFFSILASEQVSKTLNKLPGVAMVAGLGIGAALTAGIGKAMSQQSAANLVAAQLGGSAEYAGQIGTMAGHVYAANFGESIEDVDSALKAVMQNSIIPEDSSNKAIEALTGKVISSAKVMDASYGEVTRSVSTMLRTGMAKSADEALDILVRGLQQGVNKSDDLLDTFNEYPTEFRKLGLDGTTAMGLLSQAIKAGARDSDKAADALKEFSIRAIDGSKLTAQGFKMVGLDGKKMGAAIGQGGKSASDALALTLTKLRAIKDPVLQAQAATALFGTQAEDLGKALFAMDPTSAAASLGTVAGAAQKASDVMGGGAAAQIETFKRQLSQTFITILGEKVLPKLNQFGATVKQVGGWARANWAWLGPVLIGLGTFVGIMGSIIAAYKVYKIVTEAAAAVQLILNAAQATNPTMLIVIALIALVAGLIYAYHHSEKFRKIVQGAWSGIKSAAMATWHWISGTLWPGLKKVWDGIAAVALFYWHHVVVPFFTFYKAAFTVMWHVISSFGAFWWALWKNTIGAAITWFWNTVWAPGINAFMIGAHFLAGIFMWLWNSGIKPAWGLIKGGFQTGMDFALWVFDKVMGKVYAVRDTVKSAFGAIGGFVGSAFTSGASLAKSGMNGIISMINRAVGFINSNVVDTANRIPGVNFPHMPTIPQLYTGGVVTRGGLVTVGERGAETVSLPAGSAVYPHGSGPGGGGGAVELRAAPADVVAEALLAILRPHIRTRYAGNVTRALAGAR